MYTRAKDSPYALVSLICRHFLVLHLIPPSFARLFRLNCAEKKSCPRAAPFKQKVEKEENNTSFAVPSPP